MFRSSAWTLPALFICAMVAHAQGGKNTLKAADTAPPKELQESIRKALNDRSLQVLDDKGNLVYEVWLRKEVPAKATAAQVKNGLTYQEVPETTLLGAVSIAQQTTDYRKQKIMPGVFTLRLGLQPMNGDHMGTAPYSEFGLLVPASDDKSAEPLADAKTLMEMSTQASKTSHPAVFMLYPNSKPAAMPQLVDKGSNTWVLNWKADVKAEGQKAELGFGLTLIGHTTAE